MEAKLKGEVAELRDQLQASGEGASGPQVQRGAQGVAQVQVQQARARAREFDPAGDFVQDFLLLDMPGLDSPEPGRYSSNGSPLW